MENIQIKIADFNKDFTEIEHIRLNVFVKEQKVPIDLEWDEYDNKSVHILAYIDNKAVATARLLNDGHIGRMAVLEKYRNQEIGAKMLDFLIDFAKDKAFPKIQLSAQKQAMKFYEKYGFTVCSEQYMDAGIPHYDMVYTKIDK